MTNTQELHTLLDKLGKLTKEDLIDAFLEIKDLVDARYDYGNESNCVSDIEDVIYSYLKD